MRAELKRKTQSLHHSGSSAGPPRGVLGCASKLARLLSNSPSNCRIERAGQRDARATAS